MLIRYDDPLAVAAGEAIRGGDLAALRDLLAEHPELTDAGVEDRKGGVRTLLHLATDWPGFFPNGPAVVRLLLAAGAHPDGEIDGGTGGETPLHWAASSDDADVAVALIDGGADLEAPGASIVGGGPLDDAVGYGCWAVARLLVARGATTHLWHAAALGLVDRVEAILAGPTPPTAGEIDDAFWQACHGGQRRTAELLLSRGARLNAAPDWSDETPLDVAGSLGTARDALITWLRERGAESHGS